MYRKNTRLEWETDTSENQIKNVVNWENQYMSLYDDELGTQPIHLNVSERVDSVEEAKKIVDEKLGKYKDEEKYKIYWRRPVELVQEDNFETMESPTYVRFRCSIVPKG